MDGESHSWSHSTALSFDSIRIGIKEHEYDLILSNPHVVKEWLLIMSSK